MNHSKYFTLIVATVIGIYGLVGFYFMPLASFEGDLTRMAKLPESLFGWTKEQPAINPELMKQAEWEDADVLAIGDSFTNAQIWQTVFAQRGVKIKTESWASVGNLCGDISDWIRSKGFKGKYVIIQSAERNLEARIAQSIGCKHTIYRSLAKTPRAPPVTLLDRYTSSYTGSMSVGIQTKLNAMNYKHLSREPDFKQWEALNEVRVERMKNGCELFSHPRCNDVLFYKSDRVEDMGEKVFADMEIINARLKSYTVVWVVIPDKATVYLQTDKKFWDEAARRFHAPNLLKIFEQAVSDKTVDLYLANNTHVSTTGYLLLGNAIYSSMYH